jgi:hypothetical protein
MLSFDTYKDTILIFENSASFRINACTLIKSVLLIIFVSILDYMWCSIWAQLESDNQKFSQ